MVDVHDRATRSKNMSAIRSRNTKPELTVRKGLHSLGYRYQSRSADKLPCKPDIVLPKYQAVIFVHGCYWHRHEACPKATSPKQNAAFWTEKFRQNIARDKKNQRTMETLGWKVLTVWECDINSRRNMVIRYLRLKYW